MRTRRNVTWVVLLAAAYGCQGTGSVTLETEDQKASYAIGLNFGANLEQIESHVDLPALMAGLEDALADRDPRIPEAELETVMEAFGQTVQAEQMAQQETERQQNEAEGEAYLAENGARPEVTTTASGLQYEVITPGDGPRPLATDQATIHYRGTLIDGTQFDSSYDRNEPATFGVGGVIPGFAEGLQLMQVGSHYRFVIPGELAYGVGGSPPNIGPSQTLIFEVELLDIPQS